MGPLPDEGSGVLAGFVLAAGVTGWLAERGFDRNFMTMVLAMTAGTIVLYVMGVAWLSHLIGFEKAVTFGLYPFVPGDVVKIVLAALVFPAAWKWLSSKG